MRTSHGKPRHPVQPPLLHLPRPSLSTQHSPNSPAGGSESSQICDQQYLLNNFSSQTNLVFLLLQQKKKIFSPKKYSKLKDSVSKNRIGRWGKRRGQAIVLSLGTHHLDVLSYPRTQRLFFSLSTSL